MNSPPPTLWRGVWGGQVGVPHSTHILSSVYREGHMHSASVDLSAAVPQDGDTALERAILVGKSHQPLLREALALNP